MSYFSSIIALIIRCMSSSLFPSIWHTTGAYISIISLTFVMFPSLLLPSIHIKNNSKKCGGTVFPSDNWIMALVIKMFKLRFETIFSKHKAAAVHIEDLAHLVVVVGT